MATKEREGYTFTFINPMTLNLPVIERQIYILTLTCSMLSSPTTCFNSTHYILFHQPRQQNTTFQLFLVYMFSLVS